MTCCPTLSHLRTHTTPLRSIAFIDCVSVVISLYLSFMPGVGPRCSFSTFRKTTNERRFGRVRVLSEADHERYAQWLSPRPHSGVVCDAHQKLLHRLLAQQTAAARAATSAQQRLDELAAAAATASAAAATPSLHVSHLVSPSQSLPLSPSSPPAASPLTPRPLPRSTSSPLLRTNQAGCTEVPPLASWREQTQSGSAGAEGCWARRARCRGVYSLWHDARGVGRWD